MLVHRGIKALCCALACSGYAYAHIMWFVMNISSVILKLSPYCKLRAHTHSYAPRSWCAHSSTCATRSGLGIWVLLPCRLAEKRSPHERYLDTARSYVKQISRRRVRKSS
eukprot:5337877-Pyramimonas_sp.AAC.1